MKRMEENKELEQYRMRDEILCRALSASAGAFYNIDLTENRVPGTMWQVIDGQEHSINQAIGLPEDCCYTDVIQYWGSRLDPAIQKDFFAFFDREHLLRCFENGQRHVWHRYWTKDVLGNPMLAEQHIVMYPELATGKVLAITYVLDLTQQEQKERQLEAARAAEQAKTNFLLNISHDIRTPMNALLGFNELARQRAADPQMQELLDKAAMAGHQMLEIINNILDMSRIQSGKMELSDGIIDVQAQIREVRAVTEQLAQNKGVKFVLEDESHTPYVYGDESHISQVLLNLLSNAVKFTPKGGTVTLAVAEEPSGQEQKTTFRVAVRDTGIGISESFQRQMYEMFERERNATVSGIQGTGLGLAITKRLVEQMNGTLECTSRLGRGTEFVVKLTLPVTDQPRKPEVKAEASLEGKRVLLVEDNALNREIARVFLENEGCVVEEAQNGAIALSRISRRQEGYYDVVLMDIQMPVMDGYTAAREIRALPDRKKAAVPIVAMTANAFEQDKEDARQAGMNAHLSKPIETEKLRMTLKSVLRENP